VRISGALAGWYRSPGRGAVELHGDDEQRQLLLKIADRCPVHRSLENEITIASKLV